MTDQDAKFRLHILVENYSTIGRIIIQAPTEATRDERLLDELNNATGGIIAYNDPALLEWLELNGKKEEHQLALSLALERLERYEELSKIPNLKTGYNKIRKAIKTARIQPKREKLSSIAIAINILNEVDFLSGKRIAADLESIIKELFPSFTLSSIPSEKANTIRRIKADMRKYRFPSLRTGEKEARTHLTNRRDQDYGEAIALFRALKETDLSQDEKEIIDRAIETTTRERRIAEENYKKLMRNRLENHKK